MAGDCILVRQVCACPKLPFTDNGNPGAVLPWGVAGVYVCSAISITRSDFSVISCRAACAVPPDFPPLCSLGY